MNNKFDVRFFLVTALIIFSIASRIFSVAPNFSPIIAVALFSGAFFANRKIALAIPIIAMFISDLFIGLHPTMISVYFSFGLIAILGMRIKAATTKNIFANSIIGALIFFVITNFAVWAMGWYGYSLAGLATCFEMAIPFFRYTLLSSVAYSIFLFGGFYLAEKHLLRPIKA